MNKALQSKDTYEIVPCTRYRFFNIHVQNVSKNYKLIVKEIWEHWAMSFFLFFFCGLFFFSIWQYLDVCRHELNEFSCQSDFPWIHWIDTVRPCMRCMKTMLVPVFSRDVAIWLLLKLLSAWYRYWFGYYSTAKDTYYAIVILCPMNYTLVCVKDLWKC